MFRLWLPLTIAILATPVLAAEPQLLGTYRDWDAFVLGSGNTKVCYMASVPKTSLPASVNHGTVYVTVSHKLQRKVQDEVNVVVGYNFKADSTVATTIGGEAQKLFTSGREAWAYDGDADRALVASMKRGAKLTVKGTSQRGTKTTYEFSLSGFTAAHQAVTKACGLS